MEIVFLGTGGGRFNLIEQKRRTGGFRINGSMNFHVDPGPGALAACHAFRQDPRSADFIIATHNHIDHVNEAGLIIEAITQGKWPKKSGGIISSKSVLVSDEYGERAISTYHTDLLAKKIIAIPGKSATLSLRGKRAKIKFVPVAHEDLTGFGFVLEMDGARIGYTSDTEYYQGISAHFAGCDILVANNLKSARDSVPGHLHSAHTSLLFSEAKPKLGVLTHLGLSLIKGNPSLEAKKIEKQSGVRTIAAVDGLRINAKTLADCVMGK